MEHARSPVQAHSVLESFSHSVQYVHAKIYLIFAVFQLGAHQAFFARHTCMEGAGTCPWHQRLVGVLRKVCIHRMCRMYVCNVTGQTLPGTFCKASVCGTCLQKTHLQTPLVLPGVLGSRRVSVCKMHRSFAIVHGAACPVFFAKHACMDDVSFFAKISVVT